MNPLSLESVAKETCDQYRMQGYTCAESTIRALDDIFTLGINNHLRKSLSAFSGGVADDGRCGVLEAALAAAANMLPESNQDDALIWSRKLHERFASELGSIQCRDLFYPLYEAHKESGLPEREFRCVFQSGIAAIVGVLDEINRQQRDSKGEERQ